MHSPHQNRPLPPETLEKFRQLRLGMQRKLRSLRRRIPFALSPTRAIAITLVSSERELETEVLIAKLGLSKSRVSRLLQFLATHGLVLKERLESDGRKEHLTLSVLGDWLFDELSEVNERIAAACIGALNEVDHASFIARMHKLAIGYGAEKQERCDQSNLSRAITRITRVLGTVSGSYMNTGRDVLELHIFSALENRHEILLPDLAQWIPVDRSTTSRTVAALVKEDLLHVRKETDRKGRHRVTLTPRGQREAARVFRIIDELHKKALNDFSPDEIEDFIRQLELLVAADEKELLARISTVELCRQEADFHAARRIWVEHLVTTGRHDALGGELLPRDALVYVRKEKGAITAVAEFAQRPEDIRLINLLCEQQRGAFLYSAMRKAALDSDSATLRFCRLPAALSACYRSIEASDEGEINLRAPYRHFLATKERLKTGAVDV